MICTRQCFFQWNGFPSESGSDNRGRNGLKKSLKILKG